MIFREIKESVTYHHKYVEKHAKHDYRNVFYKAIRDLRHFGVTNLHGKQVLDLGCGQRFPFALLLAANGAEVTALDIDYVRCDFLPVAAWRIFRHNGLKRAAKSITRRLLFDRKYYYALESEAGKALKSYFSRISFVAGDPHSTSYPLPSNYFDLIVSNAVVEHVKDISGFASEIHRLLRRGGHFHAIIHNFYSLSGGHCLEWAYPDEEPSTHIPPWDHLRNNKFPIFVYLNHLKPDEYRHAFKRFLEVLLFEPRNINHNREGYEGERFLTPEIEDELHAYPRKLLLARSWCMICRKN